MVRKDIFITTIFLYLSRFVLWSNMWSVPEKVLCALEKNVNFAGRYIFASSVYDEPWGGVMTSSSPNYTFPSQARMWRIHLSWTCKSILFLSAWKPGGVRSLSHPMAQAKVTNSSPKSPYQFQWVWFGVCPKRRSLALSFWVSHKRNFFMTHWYVCRARNNLVPPALPFCWCHWAYLTVLYLIKY